MFLLGAVWNPQQKLSNIAFGSKFLIKFLLRDIYLRIWCLCKWKIRHLSFFCIFKCFSSLSSQFLDITAPPLKEGVCKKARTSPWDTNEQTLSLSLLLLLPVAEQRCLGAGSVRYYGTEVGLDVQGTNPGHFHGTGSAMQDFEREQDGEEGRGAWWGGGSSPSLLSSWTSVGSGSLGEMSGRKVVWNSHCLPTPETQSRPWSLDLMVIPWWVKSI